MSRGDTKISKKKRDDDKISISYLEHFWWAMGRGFEHRVESNKEEHLRYFKKLGNLRITKKPKDTDE